MKLLMLNYEYPPLGGNSGKITKNIAEGLAKLGHDITVLTTFFEGTEENSIENGVKIIRLKSKRKDIFQSNPLEMLSWIHLTKRFLEKHLQTEKYNLCIANFSLPAGEVAYSMKDMYLLPYAVITHGHDIPWFLPEQMMWYHAACYQWIRRICMISERNYVQSDEMLANIKAFLAGTVASNKLIFNGYDTNKFLPDKSKHSEKFTILFVGKLDLPKDPLTFLKAINIAKNTIPDMRVHIVGDGKMRKATEEFIAQNGLSEIVEIKTKLTENELINEYQSASLFVTTSLAESMSPETLEAAACGKYIITTKNGNCDLLISENINGNFSVKKDFNALAIEISNFYEQKFKQNYTVPNDIPEKIAEQFNWGKIVKQYEEDFSAIIERCVIKGYVQR